jgi:septal ring factor EnvC (AmiA/AmiB activator)
MIKPKGGRGIKAPYKTQQMRVPVPIKDRVNKLIVSFRDSVLEEEKGENYPTNLLTETEVSKNEILNLKTSLSESKQQTDNLYSALNDKDLQIDKLSASLKRSEKELESLKSQFSLMENQIRSKTTHQLDLFLNPDSFTRERLNKILAPILKGLRSDLHYGEKAERYQKIKKAFDNFVGELLNEFSGQ